MKAYEIMEFAKVNDTDAEKVEEIANSLKKSGWVGAPMLVMSSQGILITGSHRLAALELLERDAEWDGTLDDFGDVAEDVTDIIEAYCEENDMTIDEIDFGDLGRVFEGTWVEEYKNEIEEW